MRLLNLLGVEIGPQEDLLPPQEAENPRGYWEPRWLMDLNDEILAKLDTVWWRPMTAEPGWERRPDFEPLRRRARELLHEKFSSEQLWGWKEVRTTLTLPFWRELVPDARYVICLRNPADAISSFQRRPNPSLPIDVWGELWMEYTARALDQTRDSPRLLVFYEDLLRNPREQIARLASFIGVAAPEEARVQKMLEEIDPGIRHHSTSSMELAVAWGIASTTRMLFLALRAAHCARQAELGAGDDALLSDAIERVAPELWSEQRLLGTYKNAAEERLALINDLERVAEERLQLIGELKETAEDRLHALKVVTAQLQERS